MERLTFGITSLIFESRSPIPNLDEWPRILTSALESVEGISDIEASLSDYDSATESVHLGEDWTEHEPRLRTWRYPNPQAGRVGFTLRIPVERQATLRGLHRTPSATTEFRVDLRMHFKCPVAIIQPIDGESRGDDAGFVVRRYLDEQLAASPTIMFGIIPPSPMHLQGMVIPGKPERSETEIVSAHGRPPTLTVMYGADAVADAETALRLSSQAIIEAAADMYFWMTLRDRRLHRSMTIKAQTQEFLSSGLPSAPWKRLRRAVKKRRAADALRLAAINYEFRAAQDRELDRTFAEFRAQRGEEGIAVFEEFVAHLKEESFDSYVTNAEKTVAYLEDRRERRAEWWLTSGSTILAAAVGAAAALLGSARN